MRIIDRNNDGNRSGDGGKLSPIYHHLGNILILSDLTKNIQENTRNETAYGIC